MWAAILNFFRTHSTPRRIVVHALIVVAFLIPIWIAAGRFQIVARDFAMGWEKQLLPVTCTADGKPDLPITAGSGALERSRLAGQFHEIQQRMEHHFDQLVTFYKNYFATIIMAGVLASIAAIALLFITTAGWVPSSEYAKTIFLVATAAATYCAAFPSIFEQQQNIDDNKTSYLSYVALANEVCSYASTGEDITKTKLDAASFIHYVDGELLRLNKIAIGFDVTKTPDFGQVFREALARASAGGAANSSGNHRTPASSGMQPR